MRLKIIGKEWDVVEKIKNLKSSEAGEDWAVTYATPIYGGWDVIVECSFTKLSDLDKIVTYCRIDADLSQFIEETTSLVGTKPNYPLE